MCSLWWAFVPDYIWQYHDCAGGLKCCANQYRLQNKPPSELVLDVRLSREISRGSKCLILSQSSLIINSGWLSWWLLTYDNHRHVSAHLCFWLCQELRVSESLSICPSVYKVLSRNLNLHFSLSYLRCLVFLSTLTKILSFVTQSLKYILSWSGLRMRTGDLTDACWHRPGCIWGAGCRHR